MNETVKFGGLIGVVTIAFNNYTANGSAHRAGGRHFNAAASWTIRRFSFGF